MGFFEFEAEHCHNIQPILLILPDYPMIWVILQQVARKDLYDGDLNHHFFAR